MSDTLNHLWQSTVFACGAAVLATALRNNSARARFWIWFAASAKFLIPFSLLISLGGSLGSPPLDSTPVMTARAVETISVSLSPATLALPPTTPTRATWPPALACIWAAGTLLVAARWLRDWLRLRAIVRTAKPAPLDFAVPVRIAQSPIEPGIVGLFRPILLLPAGLTRTLSAEQLQTILAHESCHVRHRDNLTSGLHMLVSALFWFHPLVWWIGARLVAERERACDQSVMEQGGEADTYAEGILSVCRFYLESPLPCAAGITGADLKQRIREIMLNHGFHRLTTSRKALLAAAAAASLALPPLVGLLRAQTLPPPPQHTYEVVSIRPSKPGEVNSRIGPGPQGGLRTENTNVMQLLEFAYNVQDYQFAGAPGWVNSARFDVTMTPDKPEITLGPGVSHQQAQALFGRHQQRMQAVLRDRFGLVLRAENKDLPIYTLTIAKGGHKLKTPASEGAGPHLRVSRQEMSATSVHLSMLEPSLSSLLGRPVRNETGLDGPFDFHLEWSADVPASPASDIDPAPAPAAGGVSIFTAITDQLGLKLEPRKGPVPVYVIEKIEKPTEN